MKRMFFCFWFVVTALQAAPEGSFSGYYSGESLTVWLYPKGEAVDGEVRMAGQVYPVTANVVDGVLTGTFRDANGTYPFSATLKDRTLIFKAGSATKSLTRQVPLPPSGRFETKGMLIVLQAGSDRVTGHVTVDGKQVALDGTVKGGWAESADWVLSGVNATSIRFIHAGREQVLQDLALLKTAAINRVDLIAVAGAEPAPLDGLAAGSKEAQARQLADAKQRKLPLEVKSKRHGIALRWVPAGQFVMGSPKNEKDREDGEVPHPVTISQGLWVGKYEVTRAQWKGVMGSDPSKFQDGPQDAPVERVSWEACQVFLKKLCQQEGVPVGTYRLLTEAEWEYACRAGTRGPYAGQELAEMGWFGGNGGNSEGKTHRVGQKQANAWGLHDMHGNVWEWCSDWYGDYAKGAQTDPAGAETGVARVVRGGSWILLGCRVRAAYRRCAVPSSRFNYFGVRLARGPFLPSGQEAGGQQENEPGKDAAEQGRGE